MGAHVGAHLGIDYAGGLNFGKGRYEEYRRDVDYEGVEDHFNAFVTYRQAVRKGIDVSIILGKPNAQKTQERVLAKIIIPL